MTNTNKVSYFDSLDVIRFASAFMIIIFHAFYGWKENFGYHYFLMNDEGVLSPFGRMTENLVHNLSLNVEMFFLISGFVITHILMHEKEKSGSIDIPRYFKRRALRILPLYYVVLAGTPLYNYFFNEKTPDYLSFIFMTGNFSLMNNGWMAATVNPLWTLCIEVQFYIIWVFAIAIIPKKNLAGFFVFTIFTSLVFRGLVHNTENWWMTIYMHTLSRIDVLAIGSLLAYLNYSGNGLTVRIPFWIRASIYMLFLVICLHEDAGNWDSLFHATVKKYFFTGVLAFALLNVLYNPNSIIRNLNGKLAGFLGKITYGMYIFNIVVVSLIIKLFKENNLDSIPLYYISIVIISLVAATLSYFLIESPFLRLKKKKQLVTAS
jgi:peptidoglycan/LPS O-acetylase OafA/YrhL